MCATLPPPSPYHLLFFVPLSSPLHSISDSVEQQQQATCSVEILSTDAADFFHHPSLSCFLSFGPLPFAEQKPKASRKLMKSENVVAFSLFCFCYILYFSFLLLRFVVVVVGFAQLQNIFWSLTFSFAHFFRLPAAAASSVFCLCSTFWNSACCCSSYSPSPLFLLLYCKRFPS